MSTPTTTPERQLRIEATGRYLPDRVVDNAEVEELCGAPEGFVELSQAGIAERRWVDDERASEMAAAAAEEALDEAGLEADELDLILDASGTQEQAIPDGGPLVERELGLEGSGIPAMSVHTSCLGFINGLDVAASFLETGRHDRVLVVNADIASKGINWDDPLSAVLFGDAATATVVSADASEGSSRWLGSHFETYPRGAEATAIFGGGTRNHPNDPDTVPQDNVFQMDGELIHELASAHFPDFAETFRGKLGFDPIEEADWVVPHQASQLVLDFLSEHGVGEEQLITTLEHLGNCVSASIPSTLHEGIEDGRIERGDRVFLAGLGAGLSIGGAVVDF